MKKTMIKRTLIMIFVIAFVIAVYSSPAYCTSPSPSPSATATPASTPESTTSSTPEDTTQTTDGTGTTNSTQPTETATVFPLKQNDIGAIVMRVQIRLRDLGYFSYRPTGKYYNMTIEAVQEFQKNNDLDQDGSVGELTYQKLFSTTGVVRKPLSPSVDVVSGPPLNGTPAAYGELGDWATINTEFAAGTSVKVTDFNTGNSFNMTRIGGTNLATVEASTAEDYTKYLDCFGGATNWEKRSVLVTIGGTTYAASLFGNPSGEDTLASNSMNGHTTLYFYGSTTDILGFIDKEDLKMVLNAAGKPIEYPAE